MFKTESYDFHIPKKLIPQHKVSNTKLLIYNKNNQNITDEKFENITNYITNKNILFFNDTKVIKARVKLNNTQIFTNKGNEKNFRGGEIFFLKQISKTKFEGYIYPGRRLPEGTTIYFQDNIKIQILQTTLNGRYMKIYGTNVRNFFEKFGNIPLPPYIKEGKDKEKHYQTIFSKNPGSVAAPTAGLHFTKDIMQKIKDKKITSKFLTLHIGSGTFQTFKSNDIREHNIHKEQVILNTSIFEYIYKQKTNNKIITSIGTTSTRSLESLPYLRKLNENYLKSIFDKDIVDFWQQKIKNINLKEGKNTISIIGINKKYMKFETKLFIYPGFEFKVIDELITNFHLPKSSLLTLVAAFIGYDKLMEIYKYAINKKYRFFSFGDCMYIKI